MKTIFSSTLNQERKEGEGKGGKKGEEGKTTIECLTHYIEPTPAERKRKGLKLMRSEKKREKRKVVEKSLF